METLENLLTKYMPECLEHYDGLFYATDEGCEKLTKLLSDHGYNVNVSVGDDGRFAVVSDNAR